jgi:hypothetical protein
MDNLNKVVVKKTRRGINLYPWYFFVRNFFSFCRGESGKPNTYLFPSKHFQQNSAVGNFSEVTERPTGTRQTAGIILVWFGKTKK